MEAAGVDGGVKLSADTKWIEFDPPDAGLLMALREQGFTRRLAVVPSERERAVIGQRRASRPPFFPFATF